jgi:integrase
MQQRRKRYQKGSVVLDSRTQTWVFRFYEGKTRKAERIGTKQQLRTKTEAMRAAQGMRLRINDPGSLPSAVTVNEVAKRYILERMPQRHSTRDGYTSLLAIVQRDLGAKASHLNRMRSSSGLKR